MEKGANTPKIGTALYDLDGESTVTYLSGKLLPQSKKCLSKI